MLRHTLFRGLRGRCQSLKGHWLAGRIGKKLDLDAEQKARLESLRQAIAAGHDGIDHARSESHRALLETILEQPLDHQRARQSLALRVATMTERSDPIIDCFVDFLDSLRPQQRQRLHDYLSRNHGSCY